MSAQKRLSALAERKKLLTLEAELHRAILNAEAVRVREKLAWLNPSHAHLRFSPLLLACVAVVGLLAARHVRALPKWLPTVLAAGQWFTRPKSD